MQAQSFAHASQLQRTRRSPDVVFGARNVPADALLDILPAAGGEIDLDSGVRSTVDTRQTMSDRCCPGLVAAEGEEPMACVLCGTTGNRVDSLTVKALLTESALSRFEPAEYRFCSDSNCNIVYFTESGRAFSKADLRVPVWHKELAGRRTICYCFGESEAGIADEIDRTGRSTAVERVRAHIAADRCACEVRNPRGACCLGDVTAAVERRRQFHLKAALRP